MGRYNDVNSFIVGRCKCEESLFLKSIFAFFSSKGLSHPVLTFPQFALFASFFLTLGTSTLLSCQ